VQVTYYFGVGKAKLVGTAVSGGWRLQHKAFTQDAYAAPHTHAAGSILLMRSRCCLDFDLRQAFSLASAKWLDGSPSRET